MTVALSYERVREVLDYDPKTGVFRWHTTRSNSAIAGNIAGGSSDGRYYRIHIDGRTYYAHRLAILWMTGEFPEMIVDHKDGNGLNNRYDNLRVASFSQNVWNTKIPVDNTSGVKGVHEDKKRGGWHANIRSERKYQYLGRFKTKEEAASARRAAELELYGEFARQE